MDKNDKLLELFLFVDKNGHTFIQKRDFWFIFRWMSINLLFIYKYILRQDISKKWHFVFFCICIHLSLFFCIYEVYEVY